MKSQPLVATVQASKQLLDERETAEYLDVAQGTLPVWRSSGRYNLPFIKIGRKVRYRRSDLDKWLEERTRSSGGTA
jgi:excisionase family DNA binding protein